MSATKSFWVLREIMYIPGQCPIFGMVSLDWKMVSFECISMSFFDASTPFPSGFIHALFMYAI